MNQLNIVFLPMYSFLGDGLVTKQEFMTICKNLTDEQVKAAFAQFDTSGDDKLDYREFCEMINKRERQGKD